MTTVSSDVLAPAGRSGSTKDAEILIVDDSPIVRRLVQQAIDGEPGMRVVGQAGDGAQAIRLVRALQPDCMVLDLNMPGMDGYQTLAALRAEQLEVRVLVFANVEKHELDQVQASVESADAELVLKPTGAVDVGDAIASIRQRLVARLQRSVQLPAKLRPRLAENHRPVVAAGSIRAIVIAASTGGPRALEILLAPFEKLSVPVFVVQHIADGFSERLAERLTTVSGLDVVEATEGVRPEPGVVYIAPAGIHLSVADSGGPVLRLHRSEPVNSCRPAADVLFTSSAALYGDQQVAVVLTGIGQDGLDGCRAIRDAGGVILVQDEASSVVWGMPGAVAEAGLADEVLPLGDLGPKVKQLVAGCSRPQRQS